MNHRAPFTPSTQRGAATLVVTLVLSVALLLTAVFVNRNLVVEQRASAHQVRSTQAFEAAEAGLEWAVARLNEPAPIGSGCLPSNDPAATSFRERYLNHDRTNATFAVTTWNQGGVPSPRQIACVHSGSGWACSCPASGPPSLPAPGGTGTSAVFMLQFRADAQAGIVRLVSTGCSSLGGACASGTGSTPDATARVEVALGLVPGLKTAPAAALTARGAVDAGGAALGLHNSDVASGGVAVHAGGVVAVAQARVTAPAGSTTDNTIVGDDTTLASQSSDAFFASYFGMGRADWQAQPVVKSLSCDGGNCADSLLAAIEPRVVRSLIHVAGDLRLDGPAVLGTPQRPVLIVVDGAAQLRGAVTIHGLLYSRTLSWDDTTAAGALLRGAAITEGNYSGQGAPDFFYDAAVLSLLKTNTGSFARVNGSWRDF